METARDLQQRAVVAAVTSIPDFFEWKCCRCKRTFSATGPRMTNGAGKFCKDCHAAMVAASAAKNRARYAALNGNCLWCANPIPAGELASPKAREESESVHVCKACANHVSWMLSRIRQSDRLAKYAASRENREAPKRRARELAAQAEQEQQKAAQNTPSATVSQQKDMRAITETEARISSIEAKLDRLLHALGERA